MKPVIPVIAGPTAVGKTAVSVALAKLLDAEIVSADSRQIYAPFRIGTARPTDQEMQGVPHHLVGELALNEPYSAGRFADRATSLIPEIQGRGKHVVVVGGSTLYVHALIEGLSDIPKVDPAIRLSLNAELDEHGPAELYAELAEADPVFAQSLDATKSQRIIRGLEVFRGTGKPLSDYHRPPPLPDQEYRLFVLGVERQSLYERIDKRVDQMLQEGLVEEARAALEANPDKTLNAWRTIGYQELLPWFDGEYSLDEAVRLIKRNSRRYAKRQLTWYKRYQYASWLDSSEKSVDDLAGLIAEAVTS